MHLEWDCCPRISPQKLHVSSCQLSLAEDEEVAYEAVKHIGSSLEHASEILKSDKDVCMLTVRIFSMTVDNSALLSGDEIEQGRSFGTRQDLSLATSSGG